MTPPESIEWPPDLHGVPHGTPLLFRGKLQAALKQVDGSRDARSPRSHLWLLHILVAWRDGLGPACGWHTFLDELTIDAAEAKARCRRPGCRELFAQPDAAGRPCPAKGV